ncbi:MAG: ABC transporter ATP-binding protein [Chloroflexota bacterium]
MKMIQAENLTRVLSLSDQQLEILKGISFEVAQGEWVALTGPSGSGKSTLLGLLAGIDTPTDGQLHLDRTDITHMSEHQLARIRNQTVGIIFQSFNLIPSLTALENVELPLYVHPQADKAKHLAKQMLEKVGLSDRMHHRPYQLSGGQQQRVAIARALVTQPRILLADEPTGNLDTETGTQILDLFTNLRKQLGLTIVVVTHDPQVATYADRRLHLVDGRLVRADEAIIASGE